MVFPINVDSMETIDADVNKFAGGFIVARAEGEKIVEVYHCDTQSEADSLARRLFEDKPGYVEVFIKETIH